jgi:hypothetical protein
VFVLIADKPLELQPYLTMPSRLVRVFAFAITASAWISSAGAEDIATKPELRVGDTWFFQATGEDENGKVDRYWRRRIEEILPDGSIRVSPRILTDMFDSSWNPIFHDQAEQVPILFRFPMRVGDAWSSTSSLGAITQDGRGYERRGSMKVIAYETVTVPAGTFKCFRIEGETHWNAAVDPTQPDYRYTEKWQIITWYCPEVRMFAKQQIKRNIGGSFTIAKSRQLNHELVTHLPGKRPSSKDASDAEK